MAKIVAIVSMIVIGALSYVVHKTPMDEAIAIAFDKDKATEACARLLAD